jgi:hypothetical protein
MAQRYFYIVGASTRETKNTARTLPPMADRYAGRSPGPSRSEDEWHSLARAAILVLLDRELAVTISEMEAKLSDRTYDPLICPAPINPHHLVTARHVLEDEGEVEVFTSVAKGRDQSGAPHMVSTWSLPRLRGRRTAIDRAAERKRALTSRWYSWGRRNLIGKAGEGALSAALEFAPGLTHVTGSTRSVLDVQVDELDNSAVYVDRSEGALTPIQLVFEVKNTREHYYATSSEVHAFLAKAALIQDAHPAQLLLPVFISRRRHWTLWALAETVGFLPAFVMQQMVRKDPDLNSDEWDARFAEVRAELFPDLLALTTDRPTTNRHRGIVNKAIPRRAREYALLWKESYSDFL